MKYRRRIINHPGGFTLLEILVTIIISAIIATLLAQFIGGHSWRSFSPLQAFGRSMALQETMSDISSDFRQLLIAETTPLVTLQENIADGDYWSGEVYENDMQATTYCLNFNPSGSRSWQEGDKNSTCAADHTILKVTLAYDTQTLTALFTR